MVTFDHQILRTDPGGMPLEWIGYQTAVRLFLVGRVAYTSGSHLYRVRGGINARSGTRTVIDVPSILATHGNSRALAKARRRYRPPLTNATLFRRDAQLCLYCGELFPDRDLSRDHVTPLSCGGRDVWANVVAACKRCNNRKAGRTPEQAGMQLLAVPFTPTHAEYIYLRGKRILADQMEFLVSHFPRTSPLHQRLTKRLQ